MIKLQFLGFLLRWLASSIGMYFCITWFATISPEAAVFGEHGWLMFAFAGLIFSICNSIIKPIIKIFALPLAILTMGISTLVINTVIVLISIHLLPGVEMDFWGAFTSSAILCVINYVLNLVLQ